jgi:putative transposase
LIRSSINLLKANGIVPAPVRAGSIGGNKLLRRYREQLLACGFFTIETIWLKTIYIFFVIKLGTRRVYLAGITQIRTPYRATNANALSERWVRTVRQECLDKILILNERHLRQVLGEFLDYYNIPPSAS